MLNKISLVVMAILSLFTYIYFNGFDTNTAVEKPIKFSNSIYAAVDSADQSINKATVEGHKATSQEILQIRNAQTKFETMETIYKKLSAKSDTSSFHDISEALKDLANYLENSDQASLDRYNLLYEPAKRQILEYAGQLKEMGL